MRRRLDALGLGPGDTLTVVDNSEDEVRTPGYARNRGARQGSAEWLVFVDADVVPPPGLLDRYFDPAPAGRTAVLGGGVVDEPVPPGAPAAARYAHLRGLMSQDNTFSWGDWSFAQCANAAVRRAAFEEVGGFREDIRAGEDADLAYRLKAAGWEIERREHARVTHLSRTSVTDLARQQALHGAAGAWLDRHYPGSVPAKRRPGLLWWGVRHAAIGAFGAIRRRDRDAAIQALLDPLEVIAYELGRSLSNERAAGGK